MASYPIGHFVGEFARRTRKNLRAISDKVALEWDDTALVCFLVGVFVLPHERSDADKFMADLLAAYPVPLDRVVKIVKTRPGFGLSGIDELPRLLRHAVAHFNIRPISQDEQNLTHLQVWNTIPPGRKDGGKITFIAEIEISQLRVLALYLLRELGDGDLADRYDGIDPVKQFDDDWKGPC